MSELTAIPPKMQLAQEAIHLPEVQAMVKRLAGFNLGVSMPHMHPTPGVFEPLPAGVVALERKSDFVLQGDLDPNNTLPVAWHWSNEEKAVVVAGSCHINRRKCD